MNCNNPCKVNECSKEYKIYVTHHGQVDAPAKDILPHASITDLGRAQAKCLGEYLKYAGFGGTIYSSPLKCAVETAEIISSYTGSQIELWKPMGCMENMYTSSVELQECIKLEFSKLSLCGDALFVGFEKTHEAFGKALGFWAARRPCNCSLSTKDFGGKMRPVFGEPGHMPYKIQGYNMEMKSHADLLRMERYIAEDAPIWEAASMEQGTRILHISDTASYTYPYVQKMLDTIKPHIIIHTGDFADEVKAGRIPGTRDEYHEDLKIISGILNASGAKIYAVCGNNDIPELIKKCLPDADITESTKIVDICGVDCLLTHSPEHVTSGAQWSFYGHGLSNETWSPDKNHIENGMCRFNSIWNFSVIAMPQRKLYSIKYPVTRN